MICGSSYCSNAINPATGCACLACDNRYYCESACKLRDEKTHRKFCGLEEDPNSTARDIRVLKGYDALHKATLMSYALVQLGMLKADQPSFLPPTIDQWVAICTEKYLSVTLRPVKDTSCPEGWNAVRFFTAEIQLFSEHLQHRHLISARVHLQNKYPALSVCYKIIPGSAAFFPADFTDYFFYHSVRNTLYPTYLADNQEDFTIQCLHELMAFNEYYIKSEPQSLGAPVVDDHAEGEARWNRCGEVREGYPDAEEED